MTHTGTVDRRRVVGDVFVVTVLSAAAMATLALRIDTRLIHHSLSVEMIAESPLAGGLHRALLRPGGAAEYVAASLFPYYADGWPGALAITAVLMGVSLATLALLKRSSVARWRPLAFVPAVALLVAFSMYGNPLAVGVGLLGAALSVWLFVRFATRQKWLRLIVMVAAVGVATWLGGATGIVCAAFCAGSELRGRRFLAGGIAVVIVAALAVTCVTAWRPASKNLNHQLLPYFALQTDVSGTLTEQTKTWVVRGMAVAIAALYFLTGLLLSPVIPSSATPERHAPRRGRRKNASPGKPAGLAALLRRPLVQPVVHVGVVLLIGWLAVSASFSEKEKSWTRLDASFHNKDWDDLVSVLDSRPHLIDRSLLVNHDLNRALFHRGELLDRMFAYPQNMYGLILVKSSYLVDAYHPLRVERLADTAYELGWFNVAEHWGHELLQLQGQRPSNLALLANVNLAKNQLPAARTFLRYMARQRQCPRGARWATAQLAALDSGLTDDMRHRQSCCLRNETHHVTRDLETDLLELVRANPRNRMAVEYLIAHYLLTGQVGKAISNLPRLGAFAEYDKHLPRHCEEAVLFYSGETGKVLNLGGRRIRKETLEQYRDWNLLIDALKQTARGPQDVLDATEKGFGTSYYRYYFHLKYVRNAARTRQ